nr:uncharacterized protein LOC123765609 [Procambarus clarkii]
MTLTEIIVGIIAIVQVILVSICCTLLVQREASTGTRDKSTGTRDKSTGTRDKSTGARNKSTGTRELSKIEKEIFKREKEISKREKEISKREKEISKWEKEISKREKEISKREKEISRREKDSSKRETDGSKRETEISKRETEISKRETDSSKREKDGSKREKDGSKREKDGSKREKDGSKREKDGSKREKDGSKREKDGSKREKDGFKREKDGSKRETDSSKREKDSSKRETDSSKREKDGFKREKDSSKREKDSSKREKDSSKRKEGGAKGKEDGSKEKEDMAKGKEDMAKGKEDMAKGKEDMAKGKEDMAKGKEDMAKGKEDSVKSDQENSTRNDPWRRDGWWSYTATKLDSNTESSWSCVRDDEFLTLFLVCERNHTLRESDPGHTLRECGLDHSRRLKYNLGLREGIRESDESDESTSMTWIVSDMSSMNKMSYKLEIIMDKLASRLLSIIQGKQAERETETDSSSSETSLEFNHYERKLLPYLFPPGTLGTTWASVGGCTEVLQDLKEEVMIPLVHSQYHRNNPPMSLTKGILLYGKPGCGKTLIAKAVAGEVNANFLSLNASTMMSKWVGESEKLAAAVFSLAYKKQPCVIFMDEIDALLGTRRSSEFSSSNCGFVATFLTHWDGINTDPEAKVTILAATNRIQAIDPAILRRLPVKFEISNPSIAGRLEILRILLSNLEVESDVDFDELAKLTDWCTGSDLQEIVRRASLFPVIDHHNAYCASSHKPPDDTFSAFHQRHAHIKVRPISMADLLKALQKIKNVNRNTPMEIYV